MLDRKTVFTNKFQYSSRAMALKKVKGNLERMFDKNLTDLVRGIRNNKENEVSKFLRLYLLYLADFYTKFETIAV